MLQNGWDTQSEIPENRQGGVSDKPPKLGRVYPSAPTSPFVFLGAEMAAWIESHQTLREHPKIYKLMDLLQISRAEVIGHLHMLWWWAIDYAPRGNLAEFGSQSLAKAADWQKDPDEFVKALQDSGFLTDGESGLEVHDWLDYCGELIKKRLLRESERRRKLAEIGRQFPPKAAYRTVPNRTEPKEKDKKKPEPVDNPKEELKTIFDLAAVLADGNHDRFTDIKNWIGKTIREAQAGVDRGKPEFTRKIILRSIQALKKLGIGNLDRDGVFAYLTGAFKKIRTEEIQTESGKHKQAGVESAGEILKRMR